jgi:hypothetical protein
MTTRPEVLVRRLLKKDFLETMKPIHGEEECYSFCAQECLCGFFLTLQHEGPHEWATPQSIFKEMENGITQELQGLPRLHPRRTLVNLLIRPRPQDFLTFWDSARLTKMFVEPWTKTSRADGEAD